VNEVAELELPTQENFRTDLRTLFQGAIDHVERRAWS
jgi:hypothetical protein